jgi:hypothetical protein
MMVRMKLGTFIVAMLCIASTAHADTDLEVRAAAKSAARDHKGAIELYRQAYEVESNPRILTLIGDEWRALGNKREALNYYCSYMYIDAAGDDADHASEQARMLAKLLGRDASTDREACDDKPAQKPVSVTGVDAIGTTLPPPPSRISKREIVGLSMLAAGVGGLGVALYEGREVARVRGAQLVDDPTVDADALAAKANSHELKQKLWLVGGGATLITGGILYVIGRNDRKSAERAMIAPTATKNSAGVVYGRKF